jgi:hypothetical protein
MTQFTTALMSLLPLAGAVALTVQGVRRMSRPGGRPPSAPSAPPPRPIEPEAVAPGPMRRPRPDGACRDCGTAVPQREPLCAVCERKAASAGENLWTTVLHWLVFLVTMTAIILTGWLVSP